MLDAFLNRMFKVGHLTVRRPGGRTQTYGDGAGPEVVVSLNARAVRAIGLNPQLAAGEAYMDGDLVLEQGDIWDLMQIVGRNAASAEPSHRGPVAQLVRWVRRRVEQANDRIAARRNVAHHYDLSSELYRRFLDADMQYSCAYFARPDMTLEEAQAAKKAHIAAKLRLAPGMRVLDRS